MSCARFWYLCLTLFLLLLTCNSDNGFTCSYGIQDDLPTWLDCCVNGWDHLITKGSLKCCNIMVPNYKLYAWIYNYIISNHLLFIDHSSNFVLTCWTQEPCENFCHSKNNMMIFISWYIYQWFSQQFVPWTGFYYVYFLHVRFQLLSSVMDY